MISEEKAREIYLKMIEERTNTLFDRNNLPGGIEVALERYMAWDPNDLMIGSQSLHDMSTTYHDPEVIKGLIARDLAPYTRPHLVGNKRKRRYYDGR